ncbi:MAG: SUMF1/EgtB/PvdO family nonheme iron enzyme [Saprospiraceae bacterium]|nr:SUMF1/EgtB/PvdO family nonheme iron enzyme [Saprospiraceae bacterium]
MEITSVSRRVLRKDPSLKWYQRLFFGLVNKKARQELAFKVQGFFDADERRYFLTDLQRYLPLYCTVKNNPAARLFSDTFFRLLDDPKNDGRFYLLLGETGTGKTTALAELLTRFAGAKRRYDIVFANCSSDLRAVFQLPNPEQTVLLLDGIDEAPEMVDNPDYFFAKIENETCQFAKVVISCRTQFFVRKADERAQTATKPPKPYHCYYLDFLSPEKVATYVGARYRPGTPEYITAMAIVKQTDKLLKRPLLLSFIADLIERKDAFLFFKIDPKQPEAASGKLTQYEIFHHILQKWMEREEALAPQYDGDYSQTLHELSKQLAYAIYFPEGRKHYAYIDLQMLAEKSRIFISDTLLRDRSLLRRNDKDGYNFAHRAFREFFFAQLLYDGLIPEEEFPFDAYEDAEIFYKEMGEVKYFEQAPDEARRIAYRPGKIDYPPGQDTLLPQPLIAFCYLESVSPAHTTQVFEAFIRNAHFNGDELDCLTGIARYLLREDRDSISLESLQAECNRYEILPGDLLHAFFFCQTQQYFHFIHRAFIEYLCLRDIVFENQLDDAAEAAARFPYDKLHFTRLFTEEIRWMRYLPYRHAVVLQMDNYDVSIKDYQQSKFDNWYDYNRHKAQVSFFNFTYRLQDAEGRLNIRVQQPADNGFIHSILYAEQVRELDIAHNDLKGEIDLGNFSSLETLYLAGNPELRITSLPAKLRLIVTRCSEKSLIPAGFKGEIQVIDDLIEALAGDRFVEPETVAVEGGSFWMGSDADDENAKTNEQPRHLATVSNFCIGKYPVTLREFAWFIKEKGYPTQSEKEGWAIASYWTKNPHNSETLLTYYLKTGACWLHDVYGHWMDENQRNNPVIFISWYDAKAYCEWLCQKTGKNYRLPTEAEWEYAAIGGQQSGARDEAGNAIKKYKYAGSDNLNEVGWFFYKFRDELHAPNSEYRTQKVGALQPNQLCLYDMSGQVYEWCEDWYAAYEAHPEKDDSGPEEGAYRVLRGGSWYLNAENCRVAYRNRNNPVHRNFNVGFRVVFVP